MVLVTAVHIVLDDGHSRLTGGSIVIGGEQGLMDGACKNELGAIFSTSSYAVK